MNGTFFEKERGLKLEALVCLQTEAEDRDGKVSASLKWLQVLDRTEDLYLKSKPVNSKIVTLYHSLMTTKRALDLGLFSGRDVISSTLKYNHALMKTLG